MRQPISIYVRAGRREARRTAKKVGRRLERLGLKSAPKAAPAAARPLVSIDALRQTFEDLGLRRGDTVIVHSGISRIGKIAGGPKAIFELIGEMIGPQGHALYPVFPFDTLMYEFLRSQPAFDVAKSPSKMGALTEFALKAPGGRRSIHPTHSVIAFGPDAAAFTDRHHLSPRPFDDASPYGGLVAANGKILLLGVGLNSTTSFHRTEDRLGERYPVRVYHRDMFRIPCTDWQGQTIEVVTHAHDPMISRLRDCDLVREAFLAAGVLSQRDLGLGKVSLIGARQMDETLEDLALRQKRTIYGRLWG